MKPQYHQQTWSNRVRLLATSLTAAATGLLLVSGVTTSHAANGADTWVGNTSANLGDANWTGANNPPISLDSWVFGTAGSAGALLTNTLTAANSVAGITFNSGASAFNLFNGNSATLAAGITNLSSSLETIGLPLISTAARSFGLTTGGGNLALTGVLTGTGGGITTVGTGILTVSGTNIWSGPNIVGAGTALNVTGTYFGPAAAGSTATMTVGNAAGNAVLNFSGAYLTNYNFTIGTVSGAVGAIYQTSGTITESEGANGAAFQIGAAYGAYGYYLNAPGTVLNCGEVGVAGEGNPSGNAVMDVYGLVKDTGWFVIARGGSSQTAGVPQTGVLNVYSGGVLTNAGSGLICNWGTGGTQTAVINVLGGTVETSANVPINLNDSGNAANTGILNLNGGLVLEGYINGGANGTRVNFNGGTLAANETQGTMMSGLSAATVYGGGGTFNNDGYLVTIAQPLLAPTGNGEYSIASFTGGAGYIAPPIVLVGRGTGDTTGVGATAIAQIDGSTGGATSGQVTNVIITCPGVNYTAIPVLAVSGGGATTAAIITGAVPTANVSGGMTFLGSNTTLLSGMESYTNTTTVNGGTLVFTVPQTNTAPVVVTNGTLRVLVPMYNTSSFTVNNGGQLVVNLAQANPAPITVNDGGTLSVGATLTPGTVTLGSSTGATLLIAPTSTTQTVLTMTTLSLNGNNTLSVSGNLAAGNTYPLFSYSNLTGTGTYTLALPNGVTGSLLTNVAAATTVSLAVTAVTDTIWTGAVNSTWDINTTANWTAPNAGTTYLNGSPVLFNDAGTGSTIITNVTGTIVTPATVVVNNSVENYLLKTVIAGPGGVSKTGTAILTNSAANTYTGPTVINQGTVAVGVASVANVSGALGNNSAVTLGNNAGALLNLNNLATQIGSLTGGGTTGGNITNGTAILTVGGDNTSPAAFAGTISGLGGGLTKIGRGALTLSGVNTYTGPTAISAGTLVLTGNGATAYGTGSFVVGNVAGTPAAVYQSGVGTSTIATNTGGGWQLGSVAGAYGYYNLSAGTMIITNGGEFDPGGSGGGAGTFGQFDMSGGTVLVGTSGTGDTYFLPSRGAVGESSVVNLSGGSLTVFNGMGDGHYGGYEANWAAGSQTNVTTISGSALFQSLSESVKLNWDENAGNVAILNLNGGTLQMLDLNNGYNLNVLVNFNGGTVMAGNTAETSFLGNAAAVNVYAGGATVDNNGLAIAITNALVAPAGSGVTAIPVPVGGAGYIMPPMVMISGGGGYGATASATVSGGALTGITVTSPGTNYTTVPTIALVGGGYTTPATVGTVTIAPNVSGGLMARNTGTLTLSGINTYTGPTVVSNSSFVIVSGSLTTINKEGNGSLTLNGTNAAVTTPVIVGGGTLLLGATGSISNAPSITVSNGATFDVSAVNNGFTLAGGQSLSGNGTINGAVNTTSGSSLYADAGAGYGTNTFESSLTLVAGEVTYFKLGTQFSGANDQIVVNGSLTENGAVQVSAPSTSVSLDTTADYVLMTSGGLSGTVASTPLWGVKPLNWRNFTVIQTGNNIQLHYTATAPPSGVGLAAPATLVDNQSTLISVTVTPGTGSVDPNSGVVLNANSLGLSSTVPLVLSSTANVYTNTLVIPATVTSGGYTLIALITDSTPLSGSASIPLTIVLTNEVWKGAGTDGYIDDNANWVTGLAPAYAGDTLTFAGTTQTSPDLNQNYSVAGIAFSATAGSFTINSAENDTLTLSGSGVITNSSANAQTLNVTVADSGGGLAYSGSGSLILAGNNSYTGPTKVSAGTLVVPASGTVASTSTTTVGGGAGNAVLINGGSLTQNHLFVGNASGAVGAVYQTNGTVTVTSGSGGDLFDIGNISGGFGYYAALGGSLTMNGLAVGGENNTGTGFVGTGGNGLMDINGATVNDTGWLVLARGTGAETGVLNIYGGSLTYAGGGIECNWGTNQTAIINLLGGSVTLSGVQEPINFNSATNNVGILNCNGGLIQADAVEGNATRLNFNGGTLQASENNASFIAALGSINVYSGGATIDDNGNNIGVGQALLAPAGNGVNSIASFTHGAGYIAPPIVTVIPGTGDTTGVGATALAQVDLSGDAASGEVTNVLITCPGVNYTATPTFVLSGGGASTPATITGKFPTLNVSGGFTKVGSGTVTLGGSATYTGNTTINGGTLELGSDAVLHMTFDNVSGSTVVNEGTGGTALNGTLTGTAAVVSGGRFGNALSIPAGTATAAYVLVSSAVVPLNIASPSNSWTLGMWLRTSTAGAAYFYQGAGAWASGNTEFYLENGTTGDGAGTHAGGVRWGQGWESGTAVVNDGNWHFVVMTCANGTLSGYVDGVLDAMAVSQWSGAGTGTEVSIGGVPTGATTADSQIGLGGLIDEVYVYNRALNPAQVQSLYNVNSTQVLPTNTTLNIASGTLNVGGGWQQLGLLTGSGNVVLDNNDGTPGTLVLNNSGSETLGNVISDNSGAGSLVHNGTGTLILSGANTYGGNTVASNGTLLVDGSISGPAVVAPGAILGGSGTLGGAVAVSGNLSPGDNASLGTLTINNNLTLASGGTVSFTLADSTTADGGVNDQINLGGGNLTNNNNVIHIAALGTGHSLDTAGDYVLIAGYTGISGAFQSTPVWDVRPVNYRDYTVQAINGQIVLHYSLAVAPTASMTVSPSSVTRNQDSLLSVTVTPGTYAISTVTLDASAIGGSSTLALNKAGTSNVYTNTVAVSAAFATGAYSLTATITDGAGLQTTAGTSLTVTVGNDVWTGAGANALWDTNPNWGNNAAPGYVGDSLVFAGTVDLVPSMDNNYSVTSVTFSNNAGGFNISTGDNSVLTVTGGTVINNSTRTETLDVPVLFTNTAAVINAAAGNLALGQTVDNGGNLLTVTDGGFSTLISGPISGNGGVVMVGTGTATLAGANTFVGAVTVNSGTLDLTGNNSSTVVNFNAGTLELGSGGSIACTALETIGASTTNAVLEIAGGTFDAGYTPANLYSSSLVVAGVAGGFADLEVNSGGTLTVSKQLALGSGAGSFGTYSQSSGTASVGGFLVVGFAGDNSVFNQSGGTFSLTGSSATIGAGSATSLGVMNLSGTSVFNANPSGGAFGGGVWPGEVGSGVVNVFDSAQLIIPADDIALGRAGGHGTVNLLGGSVTANAVSKGTGTGTLNFNGGTLEANMATNAFMTGLTAAYVYSGGAVLDDGGNAITIDQALLAPTGDGVKSIAVVNGGSGYLDTPVVLITNGSGSGAMAVAQINPVTGTVTNLLITSPGIGYSSSDILTVTLSGGGGSGATAGTPVLTANVSGGLTKQDTGTLTLSGANTYTGNTTINGGTLELVQPVLALASTVTIANGAILQLDFAKTNKVQALVLNGVSQTPGLYNSTMGSPYLTGSGMLLVTGVVVPQPGITGINLSGTNLVISGTNGLAGEQYNVLTTTNLALPLSNWTVLPTNTFTTGSFSITNAFNATAPRSFYLIRVP